MTPVLEAVEVSAHYGRGRQRRAALLHASCAIAAGEIVGLVGPNGAGKTTLLSLLAGDRRPSAGTVRIEGTGATAPAARRRVGWAPEPPLLPPELTGAEWLHYLASHRARTRSDRVARQRAVVELAQLEAFLHRPIATYSRGMAQRLALAGAVLTGAAAVLLDETLTGIDPLVQRDLREHLASLAATGRSLVVASHDLTAVERLATRVLVLARGTIVADVRMHDLLGERVLELALDGGALAAAARLCARFADAVRTGTGVDVPLAGGLTSEQVLATCRAERIPVSATRVRYRALDDVIAATARPQA